LVDIGARPGPQAAQRKRASGSASPLAGAVAVGHCDGRRRRGEPLGRCPSRATSAAVTRLEGGLRAGGDDRRPQRGPARRAVTPESRRDAADAL
jgi:hypothetical protein